VIVLAHGGGICPLEVMYALMGLSTLCLGFKRISYWFRAKLLKHMVKHCHEEVDCQVKHIHHKDKEEK